MSPCSFPVDRAQSRKAVREEDGTRNPGTEAAPEAGKTAPEVPGGRAPSASRVLLQSFSLNPASKKMSTKLGLPCSGRGRREQVGRGGEEISREPLCLLPRLRGRVPGVGGLCWEVKTNSLSCGPRPHPHLGSNRGHCRWFCALNKFLPFPERRAPRGLAGREKRNTHLLRL